jgi:ferritin
LKIIKCLADFIHEEIHDGDKYIKKALAVKEEYPEVAEVLNMLSSEEMRHMQMLHNQVTKIIENYRKNNGESPAEMIAVYDYLHEKFIEEAKEVKMLQ